jgi:hypothetical protein
MQPDGRVGGQLDRSPDVLTESRSAANVPRRAMLSRTCDRMATS